MQLITKIFLFILSSLCLFFLVFFTFIDPSVDSTINVEYEFTHTGTYIIEWEASNYQVMTIDDNNKSTWMKMYNVSLWNNIFFINWNIEQKWKNEIHLSEWSYYFDINSLDFNHEIYIEWGKITSNWPWDYVINTEHKSQNSIFSLSSKIELNLYNPSSTPLQWTLLDIYPNMYVMYNPQLNKQIINADLLRIQNVQYIGMINSPLYSESPDVSGNIIYELHEDIKKYVFYENENNYNFIKKIFDFNNFQEKKYKTDFIKLTQNNFYNFPGEKYIIQYYNYFQNEEKKKVYYKNIILKELVSQINEKNNANNKNDVIIENINLLKENYPEDYKLIRKTIYHYYENILYSQYSSPSLLIQFSKLNQKLNEKNEEFNYTSLLGLRNIYTRYHNGNYTNYHKLLNNFIDQHKIEMNMSIYDENHRIHNYFLFFLKNILVADFTKVQDHNDIVILFQKYLDIQNIFLEKWNDVTKKTALFDNATLLKVFINIARVNFFENKLDDKWLLIPLKSPKITQNNYNILYNNLNQLLDFHKKYKNFIENSNNRKDKILTLTYNKYNSDLKEYFLALDDYNQYLLEYDDALFDPDFSDNTITGLKKDDAANYLKQFTWVSSLNTLINIRDYGYCIQPVEVNDIPVKNDKDGYCFKIENLIISWFNFKFLLNTSDNNTISHLSYTDIDGKNIKISTNYVMDHIKEDMLRKYASVQSKEKDKYDFSKFFINTFIKKDNNTIDSWEDIITIDKYSPPNSSNDTFTVRKLKQVLLGKNSYLEKIRTILPISYDYLIITRENNEYIVNIFPVSFNITVTNGISSNRFKWKFSWEYAYGSKDTENTFDNVSLLINDTKTIREEFLLNETAININGKFMTKDITTVLNKVLFPYSKIENIYLKIYEKYPNTTTTTITYELEQNKIIFDIWNGYNVNYNMESQVEIYKNNNKLITITYTKLKNYLDTLP